MSLRDRLTDDLKTAMRAGESHRVSTIRLILARVKDADIASRPTGVALVPDDGLIPVLRSMVKQRGDAIALYLQGNRPELAAREEAEIAVISAYLPAALDDGDLDLAVTDAIATSGAAGPGDIGRVMAALKSKHGSTLDMKAANAAARARLA